jgi:hypothetical protein
MTVGTDRSYHAEREESHGLACSIAASQHPMGTLPHAPRDRAPGQFGAQKERRKRRGWKDKEGARGAGSRSPGRRVFIVGGTHILHRGAGTEEGALAEFCLGFRHAPHGHGQGASPSSHARHRPASEGGKHGGALRSRPPAAAILSLAAQQVIAYITPAALGGGRVSVSRLGLERGLWHPPTCLRVSRPSGTAPSPHAASSGGLQSGPRSGFDPAGWQFSWGIGESREFCWVELKERGGGSVHVCESE